MGKKLTPKEIKNRKIERAMVRIKTIEKDYGTIITRLACQRYAVREQERARLKKDIQEKEKELQGLRDRKS